ncbi:hypothetical protein N7509_001148 [Penicillium cosmopolitanum]|uniref:Apple domain-containing protein n=1 Tax=Penicillium cosmopolitanum TaxID=1131564 RepID=A0A9W9WBU5_9EURO|nr:uncharacterized protein N7509_001148 [Penicillium cosmopolitanum]KAJ5414521.1 hypothetical protein N7509_001148 [Penicillium cosmopolitanum]
MKITPFWASIALSALPVALAATEFTATTATSTTTSTTSAAASCTASLITELCDYPSPIFAVASSGRPHCWDYCNAHPPCDFVIFRAGNPYLGTGTCWLYPGQTFDESKGTTDCSVLSVYDKPECPTPTTTTAGACAATETPTAVASVCGYPTPDDNCFYTCSASLGAVDCLSQCVEADSCNYVVFNPHNEDNSQYASGSCWMYPNGTYNAADATKCSGDAEQYVYKNPCPKPSPSLYSTSGLNKLASSLVIPGNTTSATTSAVAAATTTSKNSAATGLSLSGPLAIGVALLIGQAL